MLTWLKRLLKKLNETNRERQELERNIHELARIDVANQGHKADYVTIVAGEEVASWCYRYCGFSLG